MLKIVQERKALFFGAVSETILFQMTSLFILFLFLRIGKECFLAFIDQFFQFYVEKCPEDVEDAEVSQLIMRIHTTASY